MWHSFSEFVSKTPVLMASFGLMCLVTFGVFKNLPNLDSLVLDRVFSYDQDIVVAALSEIGVDGRATYVWANMVDTIFPVFYGCFFSGFFYRFWPLQKEKLAASIPVLLASVDVLETIQIGFMVRGYPEIGQYQALVASGFTSAKQVLLIAILAMFFLSLGTIAYRRFQHIAD